jgi:hypothetical protein
LAWLTSPRLASWPRVWRSGAFKSDQRVPLTQRPVAVCERSWAFHSSQRTWSVAREARRQTWKGSKQIRACGIASRMARWYSPLMSIDTARTDRRRSPSSSKNACKVAAVAPGRAPHDRPAGVVGDAGQVALAAPV